ncbi:uncharacterized protein A4U43_C10F11350 [Asparagus officinalis]|uniref:Uncharacterized protein n=1 Tax=Asparagus officinalis TaxID=4686 RepID=A0A5P1E212_ASPOF|nr:uncharacterized protein A4U43_C10F11350 [Asparagus officinalis]
MTLLQVQELLVKNREEYHEIIELEKYLENNGGVTVIMKQKMKVNKKIERTKKDEEDGGNTYDEDEEDEDGEANEHRVNSQDIEDKERRVEIVAFT